jgi:N6-L-threonylcarbamoyladenine synthase
VSGGHTQLLAVAGPGRYHRYGTTMDDAAGEAFDKCAKIMGLGYPGGPAIEDAARQGDAKAIALPRPLKGADHCHFSFSGLKTALANRLKQLGGVEQAPLHDLAASLQAAIADCLADRSQRAMQQFIDDYPADYSATPPVLVIAGGVAANKYIYARLADTAAKNGFRLSVPPAALCTDNAAMIAWAALERHHQNTSDSDDFDFAPRPRWPLDGKAAPPPGRGVRA